MVPPSIHQIKPDVQVILAQPLPACFLLQLVQISKYNIDPADSVRQFAPGGRMYNALNRAETYAAQHDTTLLKAASEVDYRITSNVLTQQIANEFETCLVKLPGIPALWKREPLLRGQI